MATTKKYSISIPPEIAESARARSGDSGLSSYVTAAVERQLERDNVSEMLAAIEAEHGPVTEEQIAAVRVQAAKSVGTTAGSPAG